MSCPIFRVIFLFMSNCGYVFLLFSSRILLCVFYLLLCFHLVFLSLLLVSFHIYYLMVLCYFCGPKARAHFGPVKAHYLLFCRTLHNLPRQAQRSPKPDRLHGLPARPEPWASPTRGPLHSPAAWHALSRMVLLLSRICPRF